jgi:hypothetical protein
MNERRFTFGHRGKDLRLYAKRREVIRLLHIIEHGSQYVEHGVWVTGQCARGANPWVHVFWNSSTRCFPV